MSGVHRLEPFARILAAAALMAVAWLSLAPPAAPTLGAAAPPLTRALAHLVMHFGLAACVLTGWNTRSGLGVPLLLGVAVAMEAGQRLIPGRTFDAYQLAGNLAGVALGVGFFLAMRQFSRTIAA